MAREKNWVTLTQGQVTEIHSLCTLGDRSEGYAVLDPSQVPSWYPESLLSKTHNVVYLASTTASGTVVLVTNVRRYDPNKSAIDQQPFGIIYDPAGKTTLSSGMWYQHGTWHERTIPMSEPIRAALLSSSIPVKFPLANDPPNRAGPLSELEDTGDLGAFKALIERLT